MVAQLAESNSNIQRKAAELINISVKEKAGVIKPPMAYMIKKARQIKTYAQRSHTYNSAMQWL